MSQAKKIHGAITALVTPFRGGQVDYTSLEKLVRFQLAKGIEGFVVHGTTGESPCVTANEKVKIFEFIKKLVPSNFPLIVGTGTNSTADTIQNTQEAQAWGADAALVVVPYYNKPPQRGLVDHFTAVAKSSELPILLYNVPSRTVAGLQLETILSLSANPKIIGIKEATGDLKLAAAIRAGARKDFLLLSGDDATYEGFRKVGGDGIISVGSHILPAEFVRGQIEKFLPAINALYLEANPIPVKKALQLMGIIETAELRLPMVEMDKALALQLAEELKKAGLLN